MPITISSFPALPFVPWDGTDLLVLSGSGPDILEQTVTLSEAVQRVVALTHRTDETTESVIDGLAGETTSLVNLSDRDLDGRVILGLDDAVGGAALARHVAIAIGEPSAS